MWLNKAPRLHDYPNLYPSTSGHALSMYTDNPPMHRVVNTSVWLNKAPGIRDYPNLYYSKSGHALSMYTDNPPIHRVVNISTWLNLSPGQRYVPTRTSTIPSQSRQYLSILAVHPSTDKYCKYVHLAINVTKMITIIKHVTTTSHQDTL